MSMSIQKGEERVQEFTYEWLEEKRQVQSHPASYLYDVHGASNLSFCRHRMGRVRAAGDLVPRTRAGNSLEWKFLAKGTRILDRTRRECDWRRGCLGGGLRCW